MVSGQSNHFMCRQNSHHLHDLLMVKIYKNKPLFLSQYIGRKLVSEISEATLLITHKFTMLGK